MLITSFFVFWYSLELNKMVALTAHLSEFYLPVLHPQCAERRKTNRLFLLNFQRHQTASR